MARTLPERNVAGKRFGRGVFGFVLHLCYVLIGVSKCWCAIYRCLSSSPYLHSRIEQGTYYNTQEISFFRRHCMRSHGLR